MTIPTLRMFGVSKFMLPAFKSADYQGSVWGDTYPHLEPNKGIKNSFSQIYFCSKNDVFLTVVFEGLTKGWIVMKMWRMDVVVNYSG